MPPTSFSVVAHKLGFWDSLSHQAFDVVGDGEAMPYVSVRSERTAGIGTIRLTFRLVESDGQIGDTYFLEPSLGISIPGSGWYDAIVSDEDPPRYLCFWHPVTLTGFDPVVVETLGIEYPVIFTVTREADYELILGQPRMHLAQLHRAWRDSETKAGIGGTFVVADGLEENLYRATVLSAAAETAYQMMIR